MDAGICRTSSGKLCEKGLKKGGICSQHGGTPSPKKSSPRTPTKSSPRSPKRSAKGMLDLQCDVLLEIAKNLDPQDYLTMSEVSKKIDMCLSEGKYDTLKEKAMLKQVQKDFLQIKKLNEKRHGHLKDIFLSLSNPSLKVQEYAIRQKPERILYIKDPEPEIEEIAIRLYPYSIFDMKNPRQKSWEIYKEWLDSQILSGKIQIGEVKRWWTNLNTDKSVFYHGANPPASSVLKMPIPKIILLGAYLRMGNKEWQKKSEEEKLPFIYYMWLQNYLINYDRGMHPVPRVFHVFKETWDKYIEYTK